MQAMKLKQKGQVHASMKQQTHLVYVHFNQSTGQVVHANCHVKLAKADAASM